MNGKELLIELGNISPKYYDEAENGTIPASRGFRRPFLVAAIIALMLLLMGCAAVYILRLQDMSIGKESYTQKFDDEGKYLDEPVEVTRDILTLFGHSGDAIQQAAAEWRDFRSTYDPNLELSDNNPDHEEIPNNYEYTYHCYTLDMMKKVDEIAGKYDLKLLEEPLVFQQYQSELFYEATGIDSLVLPEGGGTVSHLCGVYYPPYNFDMEFSLTVEGMDSKVYVDANYARKDYSPVDFFGRLDLESVEQWQHNAPDGTALLLALSDRGEGLVIAEKEDAVLVLAVYGNFSGSNFPAADEVMTKEQLELVADVFDYSIQPEILDWEAVAKRLAESDAAYEAANAYVEKTYGSFRDLVMEKYTSPNETAQYAFYDLNGDGEEDFLIDYSDDGGFDEWYTMIDGEIQFFFGNNTYLCEGMVLEDYLPDPELENYGTHSYRKAFSETAWVDTDPDTYGDDIGVLSQVDGQWKYSMESWGTDAKDITEAEAKAFMAQYPRIQLNWKLVKDYAISETQTMQDYWKERDVRVSQEELLQIYKDKLKNMKDMHFSHYRILDINGDGVDDLLLKGEDDSFTGKTDYYWNVLTYRHDRIGSLLLSFYLCEDGVLERVETRYEYSGVVKEGQQFIRFDDLEKEELAFLVYNRATATWYTDWYDENPISEEEAQAILAKYPRIDQGMRPISEMLK